jgi:hypothetical protein
MTVTVSLMTQSRGPYAQLAQAHTFAPNLTLKVKKLTISLANQIYWRLISLAIQTMPHLIRRAIRGPELRSLTLCSKHRVASANL